ncbi:MAG: LamG domain-containing protein [Polyangiaceae bacterium]|nr:LamG domain-containing protein [Polyangiaceae bacterium]
MRAQLFGLGFLCWAVGCAAPVDDLGQAEEADGVSLAPPPVKGGYEGNVATDLPGQGGAGGEGSSGGLAGAGGEGPGPTPTPKPETGLLAFYDFDAPLGYAFDLSGNANHGTVQGSGVSIEASGRVGEGAAFSGGGGSIHVSSSAKLDFTTAATVEFWIQLSSFGAGTILSRGLGLGDNSVRVRTSQGNLQVVFSRAGQGSTILTTDPDLLGSSWKHVAIVNDGLKLSLYVGGTLRTSTQGGYLGSCSAPLVLGKNDSADTAFSGVLDEVRLWSSARSPAQVCASAGGTFDSGSSLCVL